MSRDLRLYLEDMRDCCSKVLRYTEGMTLKQLMSDEKTSDAVMRNLEITGEALSGQTVPAIEMTVRQAYNRFVESSALERPQNSSAGFGEKSVGSGGQVRGI